MDCQNWDPCHEKFSTKTFYYDLQILYTENTPSQKKYVNDIASDHVKLCIATFTN